MNLAPAREAEIVEELAQHAEDRYRELQSGGATEAETRRITLDELSGHDLLARELRGVERTDAPLVEGLDDALDDDFGAGVHAGVTRYLSTLFSVPTFTVTRNVSG